ncbi:MAG TPA: YtxH domain-containing protein [Vicinamibacterales bacterium]|nr:YtxH domain-containing protein [Vicinamibacterales bacterium]
MANDNNATGSVLLAFVLGAAAGAAVALLYAPASGAETRRKLAARAREGKDKVEEFVERHRDDLASAVERGRETFDKVRKEFV